MISFLKVHPPNPPKLVEQFLHRLNLEPLDQLIIFERCLRSNDDNSPFSMDVGNASSMTAAYSMPHKLSCLELCTWYLDLTAVPKRYFYEILAQSCTNAKEKERLMDLLTPEYADDLYRYSTRERRTFLEVLCDFPSANIPLHWLIELIPRIQARSFSLASSARYFPGEAHICVASVNYTTPYKRQKVGLCSSWLHSLTPRRHHHDYHHHHVAASGDSGGNSAGDVVFIGIRRGSFRMPWGKQQETKYVS
jgi:sulfite reductase alpha subunit-like flavoprotein